MATLVSPGVSVTIVNESYYIPAAAPTVPLIFLATRADKTQADGVTPATLVSEHSVVRTITSLNQSVSSYGIPNFRVDNTGAPLHGDARNEYGLFALNQALTILNTAYVVRADVDLADDAAVTYSAGTPSYAGTGSASTISAPAVINQTLAQSELWTVSAFDFSGKIATLGAQTVGSNYTNGTYTNVPLSYVTSGNGTGATANVVVSSGLVTSVSLNAPGKGYSAADNLTIASALIGNGVATVGAVTPGTGYTDGTYTVPLTGGSGSGATATIVVASGSVTTVTPVFPGVGYVAPTDSLSASADSIGHGIQTLGTIVPGSGYADGTYTNVPLTGGSGAGAKATIVVTGGAVTSVTFTSLANRGVGYKSSPTDLLSASTAIIGLGSGFQVPVTAVYASAGFAVLVATTNASAGFAVPVATIAPSYNVSGFLSGSHGSPTATIGKAYNNGIVSFTISATAVPNQVGDAWTFNVTSVTSPAGSPLGANDAAKRATIVAALNAEINSNPDVRSEIYEYNLILCPGYFETISELLNLNDAINDEAFVIADCPFNKTPEDTATWSLTVARQTNNSVAYYYPNALATNLNGATIFCAASGVALKTYAYSDSVSEVWYPPGGFRRGVVTGLTDIGYVTGTLGTATTFVSTPLNQGQRDVLYEYPADVNPIAFFPGQGIVVFGQKTSVGAIASALDRVNVMRLMTMIKRDIRKAALSYLFELNDRITQDSIKLMIDNYLNDILLRRGLYDYVVICDATNNTRVDANQLWVDIAVQPEKSVEFIYIPINVVSTGASTT